MATLVPHVHISLYKRKRLHLYADTLKSLLALSPSATANAATTYPLDLNLQNKSGNTPLHWASLNGHVEAVELLVSAGADTEVKNHAGRNAGGEAENGEKVEVMEWLSAQRRGEGREEAGVVEDGDGKEVVELEQAMGDAEIGKS